MIDNFLVENACFDDHKFTNFVHLLRLDFYTAWDVIMKHVLRYTTNGLVAYR